MKHSYLYLTYEQTEILSCSNLPGVAQGGFGGQEHKPTSVSKASLAVILSFASPLPKAVVKNNGGRGTGICILVPFIQLMFALFSDTPISLDISAGTQFFKVNPPFCPGRRREIWEQFKLDSECRLRGEGHIAGTS